MLGRTVNDNEDAKVTLQGIDVLKDRPSFVLSHESRPMNRVRDLKNRTLQTIPRGGIAISSLPVSGAYPRTPTR